MSYKHTVNLPQTSFPMRDVGDEQGILDFWQIIQAYKEMAKPRMTGSSRSDGEFFLHDGPPYANGDIHMGHALNKILKDIVVRSQHSMGRRVHFRPGWDCHGLPIESQVEKNLLAEGRTKADFSVVEFRAMCRDYAQKWVETQREQFKRLGVMADWDNPYLTKNFRTETQIASTFHRLLAQGLVYQGERPVLWSPVEATGLAEAETEHKEIRTSQCWVRFPVEGHDDVSALVWTTTPWTLPANKALAYNSKLTYVILKVEATTNPLVVVGEKLILAEPRVEATCETLGITEWSIEGEAGAEYLLCYHPLSDDGYGGIRQFLNASFVTDDAGTGIVHIAPEHGPEDYQLWQDYDLGEFDSVLDKDGRYVESVPLFAGELVLNPTPKGEYIFEFTNAKVLRAMEARGTLAFTSKQMQSLPHSWRSHTPLIYRSTKQWFIGLSDVYGNGTGLKADVLEALPDVKFFPEAGRDRFVAAVSGRPDWLVSRQRVWGTPLALFVDRRTDEPLFNSIVNDRIYRAFMEEGGDAWWTKPKSYWFEETPGLNPDHYEQVFDVLDVWFDSGCSHRFESADAPFSASRPWDLYLEGSDQHRGWFQSSALVGMGSHHHLPFKNVLTHGFVLDPKGEKMSKSKGNVVDPLEKLEQFGTDVLRYWVASSDYTTDLRVGDEILKTAQESYRKTRNTFRYLLGALAPFWDAPMEKHIKDELDHYIMDQLIDVMTKVEKGYQTFNFKEVVRVLSEFQSRELSSLYFDAKKDILYCDEPTSPRLLGYIVTLRHVYNVLLSAWQPILPFTTEEAMQTTYPGSSPSPLHVLKRSASLSGGSGQIKPWDVVWKAIDAVNLAVEAERRREGGLTNLMDMKITVHGDGVLKDAFDDLDAAMVFKVSQAEVVEHHSEELFVQIERAQGQRCARSRKVLPDVGSDPEYPDLSVRDARAVRAWYKANT